MPIKFALIFLSLIGITVHLHAASSVKPLAIGTYKYEGIDRNEALVPLAGFINTHLKRPVSIKVYDSPSSLAVAFKGEKVDVAMPNLSAFMLIAQNAPFVYLAVPDDKESTYTSSIVARKPLSLDTIIGNPDIMVGMVWKDSTSGAILGRHHLTSIVGNAEFLSHDNVSYLGSHQNVAKALISGKVDIGVLATKVYQENFESLNQSHIELWRSNPIPYGPLICSRTLSSECALLQEKLLINSQQAKEALDGLKRGWEEFEASTGFSLPSQSRYAPFINM